MNFIRLKIILGYLGFLPFAFFTILPMIFGEVLAIWSLQILSIYGGIILSFLAGMTWGWPEKESNNFLAEQRRLKVPIILLSKNAFGQSIDLST